MGGCGRRLQGSRYAKKGGKIFHKSAPYEVTLKIGTVKASFVLSLFSFVKELFLYYRVRAKTIILNEKSVNIAMLTMKVEKSSKSVGVLVLFS